MTASNHNPLALAATETTGQPPADLPAPFGDVIETWDRLSRSIGQVSLMMDLEPMNRAVLQSTLASLRSLTAECEALVNGWPEGAGELRPGAEEEAVKCGAKGPNGWRCEATKGHEGHHYGSDRVANEEGNMAAGTWQ